MKLGFDIIRGGYLKDGKWYGEFDFLEKNKKLSQILETIATR